MFLFRNKKNDQRNKQKQMTQQLKELIYEKIQEQKTFEEDLSVEKKQEYHLLQIISCILIILYYLGVWITYKKQMFVILVILLVVEFIVAAVSLFYWKKKKNLIKNSKALIIPAIAFILAILALAGMFLRDVVNGNIFNSNQTTEQQIIQEQSLNTSQSIDTTNQNQMTISKYEQWLRNNNLIQGEE